MRGAMLLLASLAGLSLVRNTAAQVMPPQFPTAAMMRQCPRTSSDVKFMAPNTPDNKPCSPLDGSPYCKPPPCYRGATDAYGAPQGGCHGQDENGHPNEFCNLDTGECETCEARYCCVTMSAEQLLDAAAGAFEVGTLDATSRLTGPVVVGKRPCPRNYFCDKGRIDNYANASKDNTPGATRENGLYIAARDSQCYNAHHRCKDGQGCPEGTDRPQTAFGKVGAFIVALLWLFLAKCVRSGHKACRVRGWTPLSRNMQAAQQVSEDLLVEDPSPLRRQTLPDMANGSGELIPNKFTAMGFTVGNAWGGGVDSEVLRDKLGEDASLDTDYASETRQGGVLSRGVSAPTSTLTDSAALDESDELISGLEATARTLVSEGGQMRGLDLTFDNLSLKLPNGKRLLHGVSGSLRSGRLAAIMGPSGAGKTTFLFTLCGKATYGTMEGTLRINGEEAMVQDYRSSFGFVPQEDIMLRTMTVEEICHFSAGMRLPKSFSKAQIAKIAETVIDVLGMSHIRTSKIGDEATRGISGGQRKRVNIAMELTAKPSILFLDEPTSGLDATSSLQLIKALRATAKQGITVAAVLHQPRYEMFCLFHDVLLLGKGGYTVYLGPANKAKSYFESLGYVFPAQVNPADYLMDIIGGEVQCDGDPTLTHEGLPDKWSQDTVFNTHAEGRTQAGHGDTGTQLLDPKERKPASFCTQLNLYTLRGIQQQYRPLSTVIVDYALIFVSGTLLGMAQHNSELAQLPVSGALTSLAIGLTTIISSTRCFGNERVVFWRESASGLNRWAYFLGKNLSALPRLLFVPLFYLIIFQQMTSIHTGYHGLSEYMVLLAAVWSVSGLGYCVSLFVSPANSQLAGVLVVLMMLMCNGVFVTINRMGKLYFMDMLSFSYHMARALYLLKLSRFIDYTVPQAESIRFETNFCPSDQICLGLSSMKDSLRDQFKFGSANCSFAAPENLCSELPCEVCGAGEVHLDSIFALFAIGLMARVAAFLALVYTNRHKQV